jgi:hypothetical protein
MSRSTNGSISQGISSRGHVGLIGSPKVDLLGMVAGEWGGGGAEVMHVGAMRQQRQQQQHSSRTIASCTAAAAVAVAWWPSCYRLGVLRPASL